MARHPTLRHHSTLSMSEAREDANSTVQCLIPCGVGGVECPGKRAPAPGMDECLRILYRGKTSWLNSEDWGTQPGGINTPFLGYSSTGLAEGHQAHLKGTKSQAMESLNLAETSLGREPGCPSPLAVSDKSHSSAPQCRGTASAKCCSVLKYRRGRGGNIQEEKTQHTCHSAIIDKTNLPLNAAIKRFPE